MAAELPAQTAPRAVIAAVGAGETEFTKILGSLGRRTNEPELGAEDARAEAHRQPPDAVRRGHEARLSRYMITDPYLRFWLRFIGPNLPLIERRRGDLAVRRVVERWGPFRGRAIEPIVRAGIERMLPDERFGNANFLSAYWTRTNDPEVDLVETTTTAGPPSEFLGSIKWRETAPFSREEAARLAAVRPRVPLTSAATLLVGVSRSGFSPRQSSMLSLDRRSWSRPGSRTGARLSPPSPRSGTEQQARVGPRRDVAQSRHSPRRPAQAHAPTARGAPRSAPAHTAPPGRATP